MPIDQGLVQMLRCDLAAEPVTERKMFGGLCFLLDGNMVAGTMKASALFRVGKVNDAAALSIAGTWSMMQQGRVMAGFVELSIDDCSDDARRGALCQMALSFVKSLPPK